MPITAAEVLPCPIEDLGRFADSCDHTAATMPGTSTSDILQDRQVPFGVMKHMSASKTGLCSSAYPWSQRTHSYLPPSALALGSLTSCGSNNRQPKAM